MEAIIPVNYSVTYANRNFFNGSLQGTQQALAVLNEYVYTEPPIVMIFGPPYSSVSTLLNPVVGQYNIVQVSHSGKARHIFVLLWQTTITKKNVGTVSSSAILSPALNVEKHTYVAYV